MWFIYLFIFLNVHLLNHFLFLFFAFVPFKICCIIVWLLSCLQCGSCVDLLSILDLVPWLYSVSCMDSFFFTIPFGWNQTAFFFFRLVIICIVAGVDSFPQLKVFSLLKLDWWWRSFSDFFFPFASRNFDVFVVCFKSFFFWFCWLDCGPLSFPGLFLAMLLLFKDFGSVV